MAKKKRAPVILNDTQKRIIFLIIGSVLTAMVLVFSITTIYHAENSDYSNATRFLLFVFLSLGATRFMGFLKSKEKIDLLRFLILLAIDIILGVIALFARNNLYLFPLTAGLYAISIVVSRGLIMVKRHTIRDIIINAIIIAFSIFLAVGFFITKADEDTNSIIVMECVVISFSAIIEVMMISFSQFRLKSLIKIIFRTYAIEVIFGLLTVIIGFSLILPLYEPSITSFPDAMWYCFAVVTTIGFGDFSAETLVGRIITVILGLYGIIVVAIITSIIVNLYNETAGKQDNKEINEIKKEEKKDKE